MLRGLTSLWLYIRHVNHDIAIRAHLFVHPPLEFLVVYKATFLPERSFGWATGPFFIPPTAEPAGRQLSRFRL